MELRSRKWVPRTVSLYHFMTEQFYHLTIIPIYHSIILPVYNFTVLSITFVTVVRDGAEVKKVSPDDCIAYIYFITLQLNHLLFYHFIILQFYHLTNLPFCFYLCHRHSKWSWGQESESQGLCHFTTSWLNNFTNYFTNYYTNLPFYHFTSVQLYCFINYLCHRR
jgi:hypothetical protein